MEAEVSACREQNRKAEADFKSIHMYKENGYRISLEDGLAKTKIQIVISPNNLGTSPTGPNKEHISASAPSQSP